PEPDLAGDRADRPRPAGLDAHARPDRHRPPLGTPPPAAPPVHHGRTARHHRPPADPPPGPALALDQPHHHCPRTARTPGVLGAADRSHRSGWRTLVEPSAPELRYTWCSHLGKLRSVNYLRFPASSQIVTR